MIRIKYYPDELRGHWEKPYQERMGIWEHVISRGLGVSRGEVAEKVAELGHYHEPEMYRAAAQTLADASDFYISGKPLKRGPRGRRPILATGKNILELCGAPTEGGALRDEKRLRTHFGGARQLVINLGLTASNPEEFPDIKFSNHDILRGLYLPVEIDTQTARALGVILAQYHFVFNEGSYSVFHFQHEELEFYERFGIPAIEDAFNIRAEPLEDRYGRGHSYQLVIGSHALASYLTGHIGLARTDGIALHSGMPEKIKNMSSARKSEFLTYFLPAATFFNPSNRILSIYTGSRELAGDLVEMVSEIGITGLEPKPDARTGNYKVYLRRDAASRLIGEGFFDLNRSLKRQLKRAFGG